MTIKKALGFEESKINMSLILHHCKKTKSCEMNKEECCFKTCSVVIYHSVLETALEGGWRSNKQRDREEV